MWKIVKLSCTPLTLSSSVEVEIDNQNDKLADALAHSYFDLHNYMTHFHSHLHTHLHVIFTFTFTLHIHNFIPLHYITFVQVSIHMSYTPTCIDAQNLLTFISDLVIFLTKSSLHFLHYWVGFLIQCKFWNLAKAKWLKK